MSENLKHVEKDADFKTHLVEAGRRLVVVDFYADWCRHCRSMGPVFNGLAPNYPLALFLTVNVDECTDTAISLKVKCLPSFYFFHEGEKVDGYCGGDVEMLEDKIKEWYKNYKETHSTMSDKQASLASFIDVGKCDCVNECQEHTLKNALTGHGHLESNSSAKLLMTIVFSEAVNLQSLQIFAPSDCGPKTMKLFVDQPKISEFQDAEEMESSQTLVLKVEDLDGSTSIPLCYPKFLGVSSLTIYVAENQNLSNKTQIDSLNFLGSQVTYVDNSQAPASVSKIS